MEIVVDSEIVLDTSYNLTSLLDHILHDFGFNADLEWWHFKKAQ